MQDKNTIGIRFSMLGLGCNSGCTRGGAVKDIPATSMIADLSFRIQSDGRV